MMVNFGEKLQTLRKERGLSQENLAERLNVSRQAVSKWESGGAYPEPEKLIALSELFGVTLDSMMKGDAPAPAQDTPCGTRYSLIRCSEYEYKSKRTLWGMPLVHVHFGQGFEKARGILAVGNIATGVVAIGLLAKGILAIGTVAAGVLGLGVLSVGVLCSIGAIAVGTIALGSVAIGIFTLGAVSIGMFSFGALALGSHLAVGDTAYGHIAIGSVVDGVRVFDVVSSRDLFSAVSGSELRELLHAEFSNLPQWIIGAVTALFRG